MAALLTLAALCVAAGLYAAGADDAPGAARGGMTLMIVGVLVGAWAVRGRVSTRGGRTAVAAGVLAAGLAAFFIHQARVTAPLFAQPAEVPSTASATSPPAFASAIERAREAVRAAVLSQNLPGASVAVGAQGSLLWAEGFGWRDIATLAPVTPETRFHIGTAAEMIAPRVASLGLVHTGTDTAADWSAEHTGEPEEDFPPFTLLRHLVWQPLGLMPTQPLAGDRATFYVPRADNDPRLGRQPMAMRDLACCVDGKAFYSTPSDLVRVALGTDAATVTGSLAGGMVMSLTKTSDASVVVAVTSNIAHADTASIAARVSEAFATVR